MIIKNKITTKIKKQKGFSLLETLISSTIVAFSLLGLAIMHINTLRETHNAYYEAKAINIAFETLELIRENKTGMPSYLINSSTYDCTARTASNLCIANTPTKAACTPLEMAAHTLFIAICGHKKDNIATGGIRNLLPNGRLIIQCIAANGSIGNDCSTATVNVEITWDEQMLMQGNTTNITPISRSVSINGLL